MICIALVNKSIDYWEYNMKSVVVQSNFQILLVPTELAWSMLQGRCNLGLYSTYVHSENIVYSMYRAVQLW